MKVLTIEHSAFQQLISKIDAMDEYIRKAKLEQQSSLDDDWVDGQAVCEYLCICDKTLQRLRSAGKITYSTIGNKYYYQIAEIKRCLRVKRNRPDIPVSLVDRDFVLDFEAYLKVDYHLQANSAEKLMRIFKRITTMCFKSGLMAKDPFCDVRLKKVKKDRGYLTRHELELILNYKPTKKRLEKARDVFVFCCFTGFDYSTTASLTEQNLVLADDGSMWIETHRVKTGVASKVKLLDIPLSIPKNNNLISGLG